MIKAHNLSELSAGAMRCRAFGHSWAHITRKGSRAKGWAVTMGCGTCGTMKLFQLSQRGELTEPRYVYPDGYLATFWVGPEERAAFRLEALGLPAPARLAAVPDAS